MSEKSSGKRRRTRSRGSKSNWKEPTRFRNVKLVVLSYFVEESKSLGRLFSSAWRALREIKAELLSKILR